MKPFKKPPGINIESYCGFIDLRDHVLCAVKDREYYSDTYAKEMLPFLRRWHAEHSSQGFLLDESGQTKESSYSVEILDDVITIQCGPSSPISPNCCRRVPGKQAFECVEDANPFASCRVIVEYDKGGNRYREVFTLDSCEGQRIAEFEPIQGWVICYDHRTEISCVPL